MDTIKILREKGLSREALATMLGVSYMTVKRWEKGASEPSPLAQKEIERLVEEINRA